PDVIEVGGQNYEGRGSDSFRDCAIRRTAAIAAEVTENIGAIGPGSALSLRRSLGKAEQRLTCSPIFLEAAHLALSYSRLAHVTSRLAAALCAGESVGVIKSDCPYQSCAVLLKGRNAS